MSTHVPFICFVDNASLSIENKKKLKTFVKKFSTRRKNSHKLVFTGWESKYFLFLLDFLF